MDDRTNPGADSPLGLRHLAVLLLVLAALGWCGGIPLRAVLLEGKQTQMLSNMKVLHEATLKMAMDGTNVTSGKAGWPGDADATFAKWTSALVDGHYLSTNELRKVLNNPDYQMVSPRTIWQDWFPTPPTMPTANTNAMLVYAVKHDSTNDTVFLSSANFTNTPTGGLPPAAGSKPFGRSAFVLFHRGGDGIILHSRQAGPTYTNIIGSYVPLLK